MNTSGGLEPTTDEAMGMTWWNSLCDDGRAARAAKAGTGVVADACSVFKSSVDSEARKVEMSLGDLHGFMARSTRMGLKRGG